MTPYCFKIRFNIIPQSMSWSRKRCLTFSVSESNHACISYVFHTCSMLLPSSFIYLRRIQDGSVSGHCSDGLRYGRPRLNSRHAKMFLLFAASRTTLGPTKLLSNGHPGVFGEGGAISPGLKRRGRKADHSSPSRGEVENDGAIALLTLAFSRRRW
jgi:hypothetical protein